MLHLYAAFDVIDHPILVKALEFSVGIKEKTIIYLPTELTAFQSWIKYHQM